MNYGEKLKELRKKHNLTQKELEKSLGLKDSIVSSWERAAYPSLQAIEKVCKHFNVPLWEFFIEDRSQAKNLLPGYITGEDVKTLEILNTRIEQSAREEIRAIFRKIVTLAKPGKKVH
ncbi:MAG: helix-turn-helix transcriptional regulator [bacterium]|nr:helix-turn-helix transcriptional regulator [bacterium]